jgi:SAM-dependent methyltransferase
MNNRLEEIERHFLDLKLNDENMGVYMPRTTILNAIKKSLHVFKGELLDVGCGIMPYKEIILNDNKQVEKYIGLDLQSSSVHNTDIADLHWDAKTIPLESETIDSAMATEVLEHSFHPNETLGEIFRVLKPGGTFFFTVPFIWPLHEVPYDAYRYTPFSLRMLLENAGFEQIEIKSLGGWHASFAQMLGLWATESSLNGYKKKFILKLAKKLIPYLIKYDVPDNNFGHHSMITGLYGTALKK